MMYIIDLVLALFVPAAQVSDFFAQIEGAKEEANHEPSCRQSGGIGVLSLVSIPNLVLTNSKAFSRVDTWRSHDY